MRLGRKRPRQTFEYPRWWILPALALLLGSNVDAFGNCPPAPLLPPTAMSAALVDESDWNRNDERLRLERQQEDMRLQLRHQEYQDALRTAARLLQQYDAALLDPCLSDFCRFAFKQPKAMAVRTGINVLRLQWKYQTQVRTQTVQQGMRALIRIQELDLAFRLWQRLVMGRGTRPLVSDRDFHALLKAYVQAHRMDRAHRLTGLYQRYENVDAVTYSILVKGERGNLAHVHRIWQRVQNDALVTPDTILCNAVMDAYINAGALEAARGIFQDMDERKLSCKPDMTSYNTILKGLANSRRLSQVQEWAEQMKSRRKWDSVSTNTMTHAAILVQDWDLAEGILERDTFRSNGKVRPEGWQHPNVEAYTELLDGYAKNDMMPKAGETLKLMRQRQVKANEVTYTCFVSGLARSGKRAEAMKTLEFMHTQGPSPTHVTYNALLSTLTEPKEDLDVEKQATEAFNLFDSMIQKEISPDHVTVTILVQALGRCVPPRLSEAKILIDKLEKDRIIRKGNRMVTSAAMEACGNAQDVSLALRFFRKIKKPDSIAVNTLLNVCAKTYKVKTATKLFDFHFLSKDSKLTPSLVSYATIIKLLLAQKQTIPEARQYYSAMRTKSGLGPDHGLVDTVLQRMLAFGRSGVPLTKADAEFVAVVLRDAENLEWSPGQLEKRKRASFSVLSDLLRSVWLRKDELSMYESKTDNLLQRKGWNEVDSGFSLWGGGRNELAVFSDEKPVVDEFLKDHGWNDVDSGFRLI